MNTTTKAIRAVFYGRKSNDDRGELGDSIEQQRAWATEASARENVVIVREFCDQSISGADTARRSGFAQMVAFCEEQGRLGNPIEAVVCWKANRFSRADSLETAAFLHNLRSVGTSLMLTSEKWIDFNKANDRLIFGIQQEASDHAYLINCSQDVKRGKKKAADKGFWNGGKAPFGYRIVGPDKAKKLEVIEAEAEHVRFIFNEYASGTKGLRGIAVELTNKAVPSPARKGWTVPTITAILRNYAYLGHIVHGKRSENKLLGSVRVPVKTAKRAKRYVHHPKEQWLTTRDAHPAIVAQDLFDRVQERFSTNAKHTSPNKAFILSGLLKCGNCGGTMCGRTFNNKLNPRYYVCGRYNTLGRELSGCTTNAIPEDKLVDAVAKKLAAAYFNPTSLGKVRDALRSHEQGNDTATPERTLTARIADLDSKISKASERLMELDDAIFEEFKSRLLKLKEDRAGLVTQLETVRAKVVSAEDVDARVERILKRAEEFATALKKGNPDEARATLREMIDHVELWFDAGNKGSRKRTKFAKAMLYLHANSLLPGSTELSDKLGQATRSR